MKRSKPKTFTIKLTIRKHYAEAQLVGWPGEFTCGASPREALADLTDRLDHGAMILGGAKDEELSEGAKEWLKQISPFYDKVEDYKP